MAKTLTITEARSQLLDLAEELNRPPATEPVKVTKRGKPVLAVMPHGFYESLVETLEVLGDEGLMQALRRGLKEVRADETIPWEKVKHGLRLSRPPGIESFSPARLVPCSPRLPIAARRNEFATASMGLPWIQRLKGRLC